MLTKDLLKYTIRADKVFPKYLQPSELALKDLALELEALFDQRIGSRYRELSEELRQHPRSGEAIFQGLCKLLEDRCEFADADERIGEQRWSWMKIAQSLRHQACDDYIHFQKMVAEQVGQPLAELQEQFFGDLAENRTLLKFEPWGGERLIHRYNLAQIQGLLLRAQRVKITVKGTDLLMRRRLLQKLRFCRLMAEFQEESGELSLEISGPLAIFEQAQSYGLRLCQFLPYVLLFDDWQLDAELRIGEKNLQLLLDSSKPIRSHYKSFTGYIPEEFKGFIDAFNALPDGERKFWRVEEGRECFNLGQQNYSVPDFSFYHPSGEVRHVELFHRWHQGELLRRFGSIEIQSSQNFYFGIAKELLKDAALEARLAQFRERGISIFTFRQFPSVKAIMTYLDKVKFKSGVLQ